VFYGSQGARIGAMLAGATGGLLEDVWFGDIRGLHGLIKTVIAYLLGGLGVRFDLTSPTARIVAVLLATLMERILEPLVQLGLGVPVSPLDLVDLLWRSTGNILVGAVFFSPQEASGKRPATA
jgi:rod shape-determining protein MreD